MDPTPRIVIFKLYLFTLYLFLIKLKSDINKIEIPFVPHSKYYGLVLLPQLYSFY